jgi:hypothetical protein
MKHFLSIVTVFAIILSCVAFTVNAQSTSSVSLRIEGAEQNIFNGNVDIELTDKTTVADVLTYFDANNDDVTITGADNGYVSAVNNEVAGTFGGWDGWYYAVNGSIPDVGIGSYTVSEGDSIVLYYGDYPCQYPRININQFYKGILKFESYDTTYDENWNATSAWAPIVGATVTVGDSTYTTDENGCVYADTSKLFGSTKVQIEKKSSTGAPAVCRFESNYTFMYNDINKDGTININDATELQKHLVAMKNLDDESLSVADVNNDGDIDILDVTTIQKMIAEVA